jgi:hypothetical protein
MELNSPAFEALGVIPRRCRSEGDALDVALPKLPRPDTAALEQAIDVPVPGLTERVATYRKMGP